MSISATIVIGMVRLKASVAAKDEVRKHPLEQDR